MKLSAYDLARMNDDIDNIIQESNMSVSIYNMSDVQPDFNDLLKDFDGAVHYTIQTDIPVELVGTDDSIKYLTKLEKTPAGDKYNGMIMLNIPSRVYNISTELYEGVNLAEDSYISYNSEIYKIISIHPKEFENAVVMHKMIGRDILEDAVIDNQ